MRTYILKRLLLLIPTLVGIQSIMFLIQEFVPGGPVDQVHAMIRGESDQKGAGEVAKAPSRVRERDRKRPIDPRIEMQIKRRFGYNHARMDRYMRNFIWFSRDSFISSKEIADNSGESAMAGRRRVLVVRTNEQYFVFVNGCEVGSTASPGADGEAKSGRKVSDIYYDAASGMVRCPADPSIAFDARTGGRIGGGRGLEVVPVEALVRTFKEVRLNERRERESYMDTRTEVRLAEGTWHALRNWDNWHGFFLLKFPNSIHYNEKCLPLIVKRLPVSATLGVSSFLVTYFTCIFLGIAKAVQNGSKFDSITSGVIFFGCSVPGFVLAVVLITYLGPGDSSVVTLLKGLHDALPWPAWTRYAILLAYSALFLLGFALLARKPMAEPVSKIVTVSAFTLAGLLLGAILAGVFWPGQISNFEIIHIKGLHCDPEVYNKLGLAARLLDRFRHMLAPVICMTIGGFAFTTMLTKNSILEQVNQLYAVAARARGLSERKVLYKHILRNSLIPLVTGFPGTILGMFLAGSLLLEQIFSLDGLGLLGYNAIMMRDFPLIMSDLFVFTIIGLLCNLLTDVCYTIVDPRISYEGSSV